MQKKNRNFQNFKLVVPLKLKSTKLSELKRTKRIIVKTVVGTEEERKEKQMIVIARRTKEIPLDH